MATIFVAVLAILPVAMFFGGLLWVTARHPCHSSGPVRQAKPFRADAGSSPVRSTHNLLRR